MRTLLIEDDKELCEIMERQLVRNGFFVDICNDGEDALYYATKQTYDIIILDRMLPGSDGITIIGDIRKEHIATPVIMVTAMDTVENRIEGLNCGADDYLVKPFVMEELLARIRAIIRRPATVVHNDLLSCSNIDLFVNKNKLVSDITSCILTKKETDLLSYFIQNKNQTLTRDMLISRVWGADCFVMEGNLDNFICFLRKRLSTVKSNATIKTVRSVGYKLEG